MLHVDGEVLLPVARDITVGLNTLRSGRPREGCLHNWVIRFIWESFCCGRESLEPRQGAEGGIEHPLLPE